MPIAMAIETSSNRDAGRDDAKKRGELLHLEPGEMRPYDLKIGALVGEMEMEAFARRVERIRLPAEVQRAGWPWGVSRRST
jgi:hypothetical protein